MNFVTYNQMGRIKSGHRIQVRLSVCALKVEYEIEIGFPVSIMAFARMKRFNPIACMTNNCCATKARTALHQDKLVWFEYLHTIEICFDIGKKMHESFFFARNISLSFGLAANAYNVSIRIQCNKYEKHSSR